jgi:Tol biopolymer transport system component
MPNLLTFRGPSGQARISWLRGAFMQALGSRPTCSQRTCLTLNRCFVRPVLIPSSAACESAVALCTGSDLPLSPMRILSFAVVALVAGAIGCGSDAPTKPAGPSTPIIFLSNRGGEISLYKISTDGRHTVRMTNIENSGFADWAPDGKRIVFEQMTNGIHQIFVADADGARPVQITQCTLDCLSPTWSPDGSRIAYLSRETLDSAVTIVIDADGTNPRRIGATKDFHNNWVGRPVGWSPDGRQITYELGDVYTIGVDGGAPVRVTTGERALHPDWSPDGARIVFASEGGGLAILDLATSGITRLDPDGNDNYPVWSPDGRRIAFSRVYDSQHIVLINADGTGLVDLMPEQQWDHTVPRWNPADR